MTSAHALLNSPPGASTARRRWRWILAAALIAAAIAAGLLWRQGSAGATSGAASAGAAATGGAGAAGTPGGNAGPPERGGKGKGGGDAGRPIPVAAAPVVQGPLERTLSALGTATARSTVTVRTQVDGQLVKVAFHEGQLVQAGELLAQVDPRPFEAALGVARAQFERDDAQLQNALLDQQRYRDLSAEDSIPKQQLDTQEALVRQLRGTVNADRAQIDTAQLNLAYSHISAPVSGRAGLRQVDSGNVVHPGDAAGIVVITEIQPIDVVFPIPQDALPGVLQRLRTGARMAVDAYDRDGHTLLGTGYLRSTDNLIDPSTGTIKLKAEFANAGLNLFPNQFVNVRLHLESLPQALSIPAAAVLRGAPGNYVYVAQKDGTVSVRVPKLGFTDGDRLQVLEGLARDEQVIIDGTDKLREGAKVEIIEPAGRSEGGRRGERKGAGAGTGSGAAAGAGPRAP